MAVEEAPLGAIMWRSIMKVMAATAIFGAWHSALASRAAKRKAEQILGERNRNGLYRVFFNAQSLVTFGLLAVYIRQLPSRELYVVHGPARLLMRVGQGAGLVLAISAARRVGLARITGLESATIWRGSRPVPAEPEAQGPAAGPDGRLDVGGPFRWTRHPLNLAPVPVFWISPRMTTNRLAFNIAATAYLVFGSWHEEQRLLAAYGDRYSAYRHSGTPYYLPLILPGAADLDRGSETASKNDFTR